MYYVEWQEIWVRPDCSLPSFHTCLTAVALVSYYSALQYCICLPHFHSLFLISFSSYQSNFTWLYLVLKNG